MKDKTAAMFLAWLFWPALDFYLGSPGKAVFKLLTIGGFGIWALVDAIKITTMSASAFDAAYNSRPR